MQAALVTPGKTEGSMLPHATSDEHSHLSCQSSGRHACTGSCPLVSLLADLAVVKGQACKKRVAGPGECRADDAQEDSEEGEGLQAAQAALD